MAKQFYCFLERFNNYFNRKVIKYSEIEDYQSHSQNSFIPVGADGNMTPFDFNPNDNITTEIICNDVPFDPDYFLLLDDAETIAQRWFVMEQKRNRQGQWVYFLRRDVIAEKFDEISRASCFIEKGVIYDVNSPLLLNNEDVKVNQIKQSETLLKDKSYCAWLVMYLKKGVLGNNTIGPNNDGKIPVDVPTPAPYVYEELTTPITSWSYYQYVNNDYVVANSNRFILYYIFIDALYNSYYYKISVLNSNDHSNTREYNPPSTNLGTDNLGSGTATVNGLISNLTTLNTQANNAYSYHGSNPLQAYNDKVIKDSQGRYYKVRVYQANTGNTTHNVTSAEAPLLKSTMNNIWNSASGESDTANDKCFQVESNWTAYRIDLEEITELQTVLDFGAFTGKGTKDSALFDVVCVPYGQVRIIASGLLLDITTEASRSMSLMNSLATTLTSNYVLDLQLLPYCPLQDLLTARKVSLLQMNDSAVLGVYDGDYTDALLVADSVSFTFDINISINPPSPRLTTYPAYVRKFVNDCTMVRLCSPNYNGVFEMNFAKNGGKINKFNIDVTLRPFNPYIHVNPDFNFIYGTDFNDVRGLVCGGDFSLGIINDSWNNFEIQNKNYQAIFDRQIQNLDVNNAIARQEALFGAVAGTIQGSVSGGITGGVATGSPYGAIAGAVIGAGVSGIGGALDYQNLEKRQQETKSYAIDNYNLTLGNVRALPYSITKTSALTYNNKLFPFVEVYNCTLEEEVAYYNKLRLNGMNIGIIGEMRDYTSEAQLNFFRGKLIRLTNVSEDYHFLQVINEELMKGVFI